MRFFFILLLAIFSANSLSQILIKSEHSVPIGMAEINKFENTCLDNCSFLAYLDVKKLHFGETFESGAFLLVRNEDGTKYLSIGIKANSKNNTAEIVVSHNDQNKNSTPIVLATSELNSWEGLNLSWQGREFLFENLRSVKKVGYNNTTYSQLEESGITYQSNLSFKPDHIAYMFMSSDVEMWVDMKSQNYNANWKEHYEGN